MLDIGWSELLLIAIVALVVLGPKDLPKAMRLCAHWLRKARGMVREFQSHVDEMMREAELDEVRKEIDKVATTDLGGEIDRTIDPGGTVKASLEGDHPPAPPAPSAPSEPVSTTSSTAAEPAADPTSESGTRPANA